jgi:hypothetical protein
MIGFIFQKKKKKKKITKNIMNFQMKIKKKKRILINLFAQ